jgi:hypothetical protein
VVAAAGPSSRGSSRVRAPRSLSPVLGGPRTEAGVAKKASTSSDEGLLRCSFCNRSQLETRKLVVGPQGTICDECVQVCVEIMNDERAPTAVGAPAQSIHWRGDVYCGLCGAELEDDAIRVEGRGLICQGCGRRVQQAVARRDEDGR